MISDLNWIGETFYDFMEKIDFKKRKICYKFPVKVRAPLKDFEKINIKMKSLNCLYLKWLVKIIDEYFDVFTLL